MKTTEVYFWILIHWIYTLQIVQTFSLGNTHIKLLMSMLCRFNFSHLRLDEIIDYGSAPSGKLRIEVLVLADFQGFLWELWPRLSTNLGGWCAKEVHHPGRDHSCGLGRELQELQVLLLMEQILHQLRLVVYPIICRVSYIPGCLGFLPSTEGHIGIWPATQILSCSPSLSLAFEKPATSWQFIAILGQDTLQSLPESHKGAFVSWFWISEKDLQLTTSTNFCSFSIVL